MSSVLVLVTGYLALSNIYICNLKVNAHEMGHLIRVVKDRNAQMISRSKWIPRRYSQIPFVAPSKYLTNLYRYRAVRLVLMNLLHSYHINSVIKG